MESANNFLVTHKKAIGGLVIAVAFIAVSTIAFQSCKKAPPEIVTVPQVTTEELQKAFPGMSQHEAARTEHVIERTVTTQAPTYRYYTATQEQADKRAQELGTKDKADKIVKKTEEKTVEGSDQKVIENDYYSINLERKHDIKVGAAAVDGTAYGTISYRNRDVECTAYYNPATHQGGAGVAVTVAKW